jgi:tRNA (guanine37-N1)-methyltransferase
MEIDIISLFPEMFSGPFSDSLLKKARDKKLVTIKLHQLRDYAHDKHKQVDDIPFGGGVGMVLKPEPMFAAVEDIRKNPAARIILTCPQGELFTHKKAQELAGAEQLVFLCGHYEGFDERIRENLVTDELSIGDYVLTGGELPAMIMVDTIVRLIPGVVKEFSSVEQDSFYNGLLDHPVYTRPPEFRGWKVPDILLSGDHGKIEKWRKDQAVERTRKRRPDLLP